MCESMSIGSICGPGADRAHTPSGSIIICTLNRADHLRQTLASLARVHVPADWDVELLVVDNGSTDDTEGVVTSSSIPGVHVHYHVEPHRGQCYARNKGLGLARGEIILFTDDDVRFPGHWLEEMCKPILGGQAKAVAGSIRIPESLLRPWVDDIHKSYYLACEWWDVEHPHVMIGANMAFARTVLEKVPAFDTELGPGALGFGDDVLFSWQVEEAGFPIASAGRGAAVEHHFDPSRLRRCALLQRADQEGRVMAYQCFHWLHSRMKLPGLRGVLESAQLMALRMLRQPGRAGDEGCPAWELRLVTRIAFRQQFRRERRRPRAYDRRGLVKLSSTCGNTEAVQ